MKRGRSLRSSGTKGDTPVETERNLKSQFVFHRNGKPVSGSVFWRAWKQAREKANIPDKLFHDFRRTAVRNMIRAGVAQTVAMSITGHKTDSMFRRYNVSSNLDQREAMRRQSEYLAGKY